MYILGISCFFHDSAAALLKDGILVAAAEEERFTGKKHDFGFPIHAIRYVLSQEGISGEDLDYVAFFEKPFTKFERILMTSLQMFPKSARLFREAMLTWLLDKLWVSSLIVEQVGVKRDRILFCEHHMSHAASAFFCSPFDEAAILTIDGVGEWATATMGYGSKNHIAMPREIRFPHSVGLLYSTFTAFLGFEVNEGEYKVMGMAPYGTPRYVDRVSKLVHMSSDGSFCLDMDYFSFHRSTNIPYSKRFLDLFGCARDPQAPFFTRSSGYPAYFGPKPGNFTEQAKTNEYYADIAASIQTVTEQLIVNMARAVQRETGLKRLCLAGGVGLNSVANRKILSETAFEELYVQPAAGDSGAALGAALYIYHAVLGHSRNFVMEHAFWGQGFSDEDINAELNRLGVAYQRVGDEEVLDRTAEALAHGAVIGWYQGRFEWGPRALGHRSILADPRRAEMKDIVNTKIKFREPYRPFAPSILCEYVNDYFDPPGMECQYPARFMLLVADIKPEKHDIIPAVTHVDGTGRLQTVVRDTNERYYQLIDRFHQATGVPVVLNTSFNLRGETIVRTPAEAYSTFVRSEMDMLVLGNHIIHREKAL
jgi:carbamoyltransferase